MDLNVNAIKHTMLYMPYNFTWAVKDTYIHTHNPNLSITHLVSSGIHVEQMP